MPSSPSKTKSKKKKISLLALGFNKKPDPNLKGYVTSDSVRSN